MGSRQFSRLLSKLSFLFFILGVSFLLSGCGFIGDSNSVSGSDPSLTLLSQLFGTPLSTSLSGVFDPTNPLSKSALVFPILIHAFNMGVIGGAMMIFAYIAVMGTLYTAQDGVFLGKKWAKTLIPLRAVIGIVAIFPMGVTGFGIAQYIIYAMTYMGVGLANSVWGAVATAASPGGLSPGIPQTVLQGINSAIGEMVFYDVVRSITTAKTTPAPAALNSPKALFTTTLCSGGSTVCISIPPTPLTQAMFNAIGSSNTPPPSGSPSGVTNLILLSVDAVCRNNAKHYNTSLQWCDDVTSQIQVNLNNGSINPKTRVGNIQYLVTSTNNSNSVGDYVESRFVLQLDGYINGLPAPPTSMPPSTSAPTPATPCGSGSATDPVTAACLMAESSANTIEGYIDTVAPDTFSQGDYLAAMSLVVTAVTNYYANSAPGSTKPENFSGSWWLAGDEYLYLDQIFAEESSDLIGIVSQFQTAVTGDIQNLITITNGGIYANLTKLNFTQSQFTGDWAIPIAGYLTGTYPTSFGPNGSANLPGNGQISECGTSPSEGAIQVPNVGCGWMLYSPLQPIFTPLSLNTYLIGDPSNPSSIESSLAVQSGPWATSAPFAYAAALDLLCKFAGVCGTGSATDPISIALNGLPDPLGLGHHLLPNQGPVPAMLEDLYYFFALRAAQSVAYTPQEIYTLDVAVNYAYNAYQMSNTSDPCPNLPASSTLQCNQNSAGFSNPMIMAGQNSPLAGVMGFIFSGLVGVKSGPNNVAGLMAQIWCVGEVDFGNCMSHVQQSTGQSSGFSGLPSSDIAGAHFSVIANAQWVGMNLIGGSVAALTSIYTNFADKMKGIESSVSSAGDLSAGDWAGMSVPGFGGIVSAELGKSLVKSTTAAAVSIAAASVNLMWIPVIMIVLTTLFTTGVMFAIFIPMLPFVLFWAGKIAWLLLVIEAIFAAPLMAMAMAYPEGHDLWGMGEQGFKISLNLLLMPVLMIVGLVSAMALTYFILNMTASGFHYVTMALLKMAQSSSGGSSSVPGTAYNSLITQGIMSTFLIFMYASFISMAFNKSFSTIYVIPERVMAWIGSQGMKFGEKEGGEMQGAVSKQADQAAQGGGQAVSQGTQAQKGVADSKVSQAQQEGQADIQIGSAVGQSTTTAVTTAASIVGGG